MFFLDLAHLTQRSLQGVDGSLVLADPIAERSEKLQGILCNPALAPYLCQFLAQVTALIVGMLDELKIM